MSTPTICISNRCGRKGVGHTTITAAKYRCCALCQKSCSTMTKALTSWFYAKPSSTAPRVVTRHGKCFLLLSNDRFMKSTYILKVDLELTERRRAASTSIGTNMSLESICIYVRAVLSSRPSSAVCCLRTSYSMNNFDTGTYA
jgi:hypothetical protein